MNLLNAEGLEKSQGGRLLFSDLTIGIEEGERAALIGENGCGKSTLLRMLAGKESCDKGSIARNKDCRIAFLEQTSPFNSDDAIIEHILRGSSPRASVLRRFERCSLKAQSGDLDASEKLLTLSDEMDRLGAWDYERLVHSVLTGFGITNLEIKMGEISGGMNKKVALAQTLIEESNCLFLDEPTNHLDIDSIVWLQDYLSKYSGAIIMVTHDRYFLDEVCNSIYEIDGGKLYKYKGNYSYYLEQRAARIDALVSMDKRVANILRTELEWLRRGPKARGTKAKARKDNAYRLMNHSAYKEADSIAISITGKKLGKKILEAEGLSKSYGSREIISDFCHVFKHSERIGIAGLNGSGKTTLLNMLTGVVSPDSGTVDVGMHTVFGFFTQQNDEADPGERVIDYVEKRGKLISLADGSSVTAAKILEMFLFPPGQHHTPVIKLSGGERRRLFLLQVLMGNPNFLVLDEPTNDLDVKTLSILEDFLQGFAGCIIIVSHDRFFMDRVADYIFVLDGSGSVKSFPGSFSEYLAFAKENKPEKESSADKTEKKDSRAESRAQKEKTKLSYKETLEYQTIESDIKKLEDEKNDIHSAISSGSEDVSKYAEWNNRLQELDVLINEKYQRWEYLERYSPK